MLDLSKQSDREKLEELIADDIDLFCETYYEQGHRNHLGASGLGEACWRKLWYSFRWVKEEKFDGRMMRLFNVGHSAEPRFVAYLRGIGFDVKEFDEDGKQFRISGAMGHYGGSLDGMCKAPAKYQLSEDIILSLSFKTNNTGSGYEKVSKEALSKSKPMHWAQECQYGYKTGIRYCIYMIENKNDSDITFKVIELDWNYGAQLEKKANEIIFSKEPPPRISENPALYDCKYCHLTDICHKGAPPEKNCRSCRNASPVENAQWFCYAHNSNIPSDFIRKGCDLWLPI
jgi:hypothetical protein